MTKKEEFDLIVEAFINYEGVHADSIRFLIERVQELEAALKTYIVGSAAMTLQSRTPKLKENPNEYNPTDSQ